MKKLLGIIVAWGLVFSLSSLAYCAFLGDFNDDGDVDGLDLVIQANDDTGVALENFAADFGGVDIENLCTDIDCGEHGTCVEGICECDENYSGDQCEIYTDPCYGVNCGEHGSCTDGICICTDGFTDDRCETPPPRKYVFITEVIEYPGGGKLEGIVGADMICQGFASTASLPGTYKAWLSDSSGTVYPANSFTHSIHPYVLVDGTTVAHNWTDLTDGAIEVPINMIAAGIINPNIKVWTNVTTAGECFTTVDAPMHTCNNWTSNSYLDYGFTGTTLQPNTPPPGWENHWTEHNILPCNDRDVRLYCFQQ